MQHRDGIILDQSHYIQKLKNVIKAESQAEEGTFQQRRISSIMRLGGKNTRGYARYCTRYGI